MKNVPTVAFVLDSMSSAETGTVKTSATDEEEAREEPALPLVDVVVCVRRLSAMSKKRRADRQPVGSTKKLAMRAGLQRTIIHSIQIDKQGEQQGEQARRARSERDSEDNRHSARATRTFFTAARLLKRLAFPMVFFLGVALSCKPEPDMFLRRSDVMNALPLPMDFQATSIQRTRTRNLEND